MLHAAVYSVDPIIKGVVHVHLQKLWESFLHHLPTTDPEIGYDTPEIAWEIERLYFETKLPAKRLLVIGGHEGSIITFGYTVAEASWHIFEHDLQLKEE